MHARLIAVPLFGFFGIAVAAFATPPGQLTFVAIQPCRAVDTRAAAGLTGQFGSPAMGQGETRSIQLWSSPNCSSIPSTVKAYALNITVVPAGGLSYLSVWPTGVLQPVVSTLNDFAGSVMANAAVAPAGTSGAVSIFTTDTTELIIDITGYFADLSAPAGPTGATGAAGPTGPAGPQGETGVAGPAGPAGPIGPAGAPVSFLGSWSNSSTYIVGDTVFYNGSSYISLTAGNIANTPGSSPSQWSLLAQQGSPGATGPIGATGATGNVGVAGPTGAVGPAGPQGPQGNQGLIGLSGAPGPIGATGSAGAAGPSGPQGPQGNPGPIGVTGAVGPVGAAGPPVSYLGAWSNSSTYIVGDAVFYNGSSYISLTTTNINNTPGSNPTIWALLAQQGGAGPAGPAGEPGNTGAAGPVGAAGAAGPVGPQGPQGNQGPIGAMGAVGPAGASGPPVSFLGLWSNSSTYTVGDAVFYNGSSYISLTTTNINNTPGSNPTIWALLAQQGAAGPTGPAGAVGSTGATGSTGPTGATGPAGAPGAPGATGATGPAGGITTGQASYAAQTAIAYGNASGGALHITSNEDWSGYISIPSDANGGLMQFSTITVDSGVTWKIPSGLTLQATGNITINGAIVVAPGTLVTTTPYPQGIAVSGAGSQTSLVTAAVALAPTALQLSQILYPPTQGGGEGLPSGSTTTSGGTFGQGGGALVVRCGSTITIGASGSITANGNSAITPTTYSGTVPVNGAIYAGAGGGGGGVVILAAASAIVNSGTVRANGGNGALAVIFAGNSYTTSSTTLGGGGGGGGGLIHFLSPAITAGTTSVVAGTNAGTFGSGTTYGGVATGGGASAGNGGFGAQSSVQNNVASAGVSASAGLVLSATLDPTYLFTH